MNTYYRVNSIYTDEEFGDVYAKCHDIIYEEDFEKFLGNPDEFDGKENASALLQDSQYEMSDEVRLEIQDTFGIEEFNRDQSYDGYQFYDFDDEEEEGDDEEDFVVPTKNLKRESFNLREALNNIDINTDNRYDLLNLYEACNLSENEKRALANIVYDQDNAEVIYDTLNDRYISGEEIGMPERVKNGVIHEDTEESYTAFIYEDDGITAADLSTYDDKEEAISFAKARKWDEVVDDITGKVVWSNKTSIPDELEESKSITEDFSSDPQDLYKEAMKAYDNNDDDFFYNLSDDELVTLWVSCAITKDNPYGAAYDDEVYDAISERENSRELFDKAANIVKSESKSIEESLASRLVDFIKDYDFYHYSDTLEIGDTEEDAIKEMDRELADPKTAKSLLDSLIEMSKEDNLDDEQKEIVSSLISGVQSVVDKNQSKLTETTNKEYDARKKSLYQKVRKRLGVDNLIGTHSQWTDEENTEEKELSCISMLHSKLAYEPDSTIEDIMTDRYMARYIDELGEQRVRELAQQEIEEFANATILRDVHTDSEGVSYNSVRFRDDITESWEKGDSVTLWWKDPDWHPTAPSYATCTYVGKTKDGKHKFTSDTYGWEYLLDTKNKKVITHNGKEFDVHNDSGWLNNHLEESLYDDDDKPFTHKQVFDELKRETRNFTIDGDTIQYGYESEVEHASKILKRHYDSVECNGTKITFKDKKKKGKKVTESVVDKNYTAEFTSRGGSGTQICSGDTVDNLMDTLTKRGYQISDTLKERIIEWGKSDKKKFHGPCLTIVKGETEMTEYTSF